MKAMIPRILLALCSFVLALGGVAHAAAFGKATKAIAGAANLSAFFGNDFRTLWLADSATLLLLAALFALIAARPSAATRPVVLLLALIPAATGVLIYAFVGNFYAGHLLVGTAAVAFGAGLRLPKGAGEP